MNHASPPTDPPFLAELSEDVVLAGSTLMQVLVGREAVAATIRTVGTLYASQVHTLHGSVDGHEVLQYYAVIAGSGTRASATVVLDRDDLGEVAAIWVGHAPLGAALEISALLRDALAGVVDPVHFVA